MFLLNRVWHDDQEEVKILCLLRSLELSTLGVLAADVGAVVVIDSVFECFNTGLVTELNDITVIDVNIESSLL